MKKCYIKPDVMIEDFKLNMFIANCNSIVRATDDACIDLSLGAIIASNMDKYSNLFWPGACETGAGQDTPLTVDNADGTFCYNTPTGVAVEVVFSS